MDLFKLSIVFTCSLAVVFQCTTIIEAVDDGLTIELTTGTIIGKLEVSKSTPTKNIRVFRGIPFAEPPLGELRFKAPVPIANWTVAKDLTNNGVVDCIQVLNYLGGVTSEDCLTINVYTPQNVDATNPLPVMVWFYGGGFVAGSTNPGYQGGDFLLDQGLVFVSVNYRVSALGFLNLGTPDAPGNAGLKDQNLGLQWVKNEISKFGGDPNKVTIFGESAGSASVIFHYLSPKSIGLFQYAIAQSGNALSDWTFLETGFKERGKQFSDLMNCTKNGDIDIKCLQTADVSLYKKYQDIPMPDEAIIRGSSFAFVPSVEEKSETAFLTDTPANLIKNSITKVPLIMGVNHDEGMMEMREDNSNYYPEFPSKLAYFIPKSIRDKKSSNQLTKDAASINTEYLNNTVPGKGNYEGLIRLYTDVMFTVGTAQFARQRASQGNIYLYHFDFDGNFRQKDTSAMKLNLTGVNHGEEKRYILTQSDINQYGTPEDAVEKKVLRRMVKLWSNFAKTGNPTPANDTDSKAVLGDFQWTPVQTNSTYYLIITDQIKMSQDNFHEKAVNFWEGINTSFGCRISYSLFVLSLSLIIKWLF